MPSRAGAVCLFGGLLSLLMAISLWLRPPAIAGDGITWELPIAPGHALTFTLWTHDLACSPLYTTGGLTRQRPGPLRLTVRHENWVAGTREYLMVLRIPTWPLVAAAIMMAMAGGWLWRSASSGGAQARS